MSRRKLTVIWPVDPFEKASETRQQIAAILTRLSGSMPLEIEPVFLLCPFTFNLEVVPSRMWLRSCRNAGEKALKHAIRGLDVPGLAEPKVLIEDSASMADAAKAVLGYAKTRHADLITLGTHGRKGLNRLFVGSFAETLMLYSKLPVLVVGSSATPAVIRHILFPTDFGSSATALFRKILVLAKAMGAKVTIFHSVKHPIEPIVQSGVYLAGGGWVEMPDFMTEQEQKNDKRADGWMRESKKLGVPVDIIRESGSGSISESILRHASREGADMIAMAAESGRVRSALMGSVSRQVVRGARCPVWVLRL